MATQKGQVSSKSKTTGGDVALDLNKLKSALQAAVAEIQKLTQEGGKAENAAKAAASRAVDATGDQIQIWEDDPFLAAAAGAEPIPATPILEDAPQNNQPLLQTQIVDQQQPAQGIFDPSTPEFRFWNAASALARGINFWGPLLPPGTVWTTVETPLRVQLDEGVDFNAFFARDSGLNFFHGVVTKLDPNVTVFSGESPDVVCHELGHAILDAVKPELFDAMSLEVAAFHEAFGDMSSMLSALQIESFREFVLNETGGDLSVNSRLSQLARQLGWAIRVMIGAAAVDADSLRNTCNNFFYQDPAGLPPNGPASRLTSEPHHFSRVFSGAFLEVLAGMFTVGPVRAANDPSSKLEDIARDAGKLLIEGVRLAAVGPGFYSQVAAGMIQADQTLNGGHYRNAMTSSFVHRGILSPSSAVSLSRDLQSQGAHVFGVTGLSASRHVQFEGDNEGYKKTSKDAPALPLRQLRNRFGSTFHVHMPAEPNRFGVAAAALGDETEKAFSPEEDARSFVEDLIQLGRIAHHNTPGVIPAELTSPGTASPCDHTHVLIKEDGKTVLKRHHFDCGFRGCTHGRK